MARTKVLVPRSLGLEITHDDVDVFEYDPHDELPPESLDAEVLIEWGMPQPLLNKVAKTLKSLRWIQTLSAGADSILEAGFRRDVVITNGRSLHDKPVAEHALALTLAAARSLHTLVRAQIGHRWASELGGPQPPSNPDRLTTLRGARVAIWGFGSIGKTLAPLLTMLGATVCGVGRTPREEDGYQVHAQKNIGEILPAVDVLIMILPSTPDTRHSLNADLLGSLSPHAWVVNVGRGSTIDEEQLINALRSNIIGGAALDVTSEEPLPVDSPLWALSNVILSPHAAGGRPLGASELVQENLDRFISDRTMCNLVRPR